MSEHDVIKGTSTPVTLESLTRDLRNLGVDSGQTLLVHSSMSKIGWVSGGAVAVILALEEALGPDGTLVMPAHSTDLSDPAKWEAPPVPESWVQTIRDTMPAFSPDLTPTRAMGKIAECFRKRDGVIRSNHPQSSFCSKGPNAEAITTNHGLVGGLGEQSPLARLYELDGWVLLLGVGHGNNTSLHLAEVRAEFPGKKTIREGAPVLVDGQRQWVTFEDVEPDEEGFPELGEAFKTTGAVKSGKIGNADALLMSQRALVDYGVQWMEANRT